MVKGMKIMVTDGACFVDSHEAECCARLGEEVVVYDNVSWAKLLNYSTFNVLEAARHTPYGTGKFAIDMYIQDYARCNKIDKAELLNYLEETTGERSVGII